MESERTRTPHNGHLADGRFAFYHLWVLMHSGFPGNKWDLRGDTFSLYPIYLRWPQTVPRIYSPHSTFAIIRKGEPAVGTTSGNSREIVSPEEPLVNKISPWLTKMASCTQAGAMISRSRGPIALRALRWEVDAAHVERQTGFITGLLWIVIN